MGWWQVRGRCMEASRSGVTIPVTQIAPQDVEPLLEPQSPWSDPVATMITQPLPPSRIPFSFSWPSPQPCATVEIPDSPLWFRSSPAQPGHSEKLALELEDTWHLFPIEQGCLYVSQKLYISELYRIKYAFGKHFKYKERLE